MLFSGCGNDLGPEESCGFQVNSKHRRVSWFRTPIVFYADDSLSWQQVAAVHSAMQKWNKHFDRDIFKLVGDGNQRSPELADPVDNNGDGRVDADNF